MPIRIKRLLFVLAGSFLVCVQFRCTFVGGLVTDEDKEYEENLIRLVSSEGIEDRVFLREYCSGNLFPIIGEVGYIMRVQRLDKVVIEGMLGGAISIVENESFQILLEVCRPLFFVIMMWKAWQNA